MRNEAYSIKYIPRISHWQLNLIRTICRILSSVNVDNIIGLIQCILFIETGNYIHLGKSY